MKNKPLSGFTLVEMSDDNAHSALARAIAFSGRIAADLGATVMRITGAYEAALAAGPKVGSVAADYAFLMAGKTLVSGGSAERERLLQTADGVFTDGALAERLGMALLPPATVLVGFSTNEADLGSHSEFTAMAASGLLDLVGERDRQPLRMAGTQLSYAAGLSAYTGMVGALCVASRAKPQRVRVNLLDIGLWLNWKTVVTAGTTGKLQTRSGRDAEWQVLRCADGWVAMVYRESDWPKLKRLLNDARLDEARFASRVSRRQHGAELADIFEQGMLPLSRADIRFRSRAEGIPLGPVWSPSELLRDEQNTSRLFFVDVPVGPDGAVRVPRLPVLWGMQPMLPGAVPLADARVAS